MCVRDISKLISVSGDPLVVSGFGMSSSSDLDVARTNPDVQAATALVWWSDVGRERNN